MSEEVKDTQQQEEPAKATGRQEAAAGTPETETPAAETAGEEQKLEELGQKLAEINDKYLRLSAEFDNYRKRTLKERMELLKSAGEGVLEKILPVMDNFERALASMEKATDVPALREGVELIYHSFREFLAQQGVQEMDCLHADFDADLHEAVTKIPAPAEELKGKVVDCIQKGYMLHDKVMRFPKVVVGE